VKIQHTKIRMLRTGFTLIELLTVVSIVGILAVVGISFSKEVLDKSLTIKCASKMRALGQAVQSYCADHGGEFPRSWHSAGAYREPGWAVSIAPFLGISEEDINSDWERAFNRFYRSPVDNETSPFLFSYALNVHFELNPGGDDYEGSPATWRRQVAVPSPSRTILMAQSKPVFFGDHLMCHQWSSLQALKNALNHDVHGGFSHYLFVDGHIEKLPGEQTFNPNTGLNLWNPALAAQ
jgi:prepilin-type N-terminal cleavage/methylation domain-containing protein/prepilin-type processing-associated H-X9-DG protein